MNIRPIIFNLTRLMGRMRSLAPTGIDRLDIRYARHFLDSHDGRPALFVHQFRNSLTLIPASAARVLIDTLWSRWMHSDTTDGGSISHRVKSIHVMARLKSTALSMLATGIDPLLVKALHNGPPPVFINAGHTGVQHAEIHENLRGSLKADMVYYLHDLIPIDYPEYVKTTAYADIHVARVACMARTGSLIITNSRYTRDRFHRFCNENKLSPPRCEVLEIGVEDAIVSRAGMTKAPLSDQLASHLENKPYFVVTGTIEPRKNHLMLLQIWRQLAQDLGEGCPKLVLIGRRGWENENVVDMLERCPQVRKNVIELGSISDAEMIPIVQHAVASLYPSFEEGWGIPVTESLALGTPTMCSDIPALRECSQGRATFLHPLDGVSWLQAVRAMTVDSVSCRGAEGMVPHPASSGFKAVNWRWHLEGLDGMLRTLDTPNIIDPEETLTAKLADSNAVR